MLKISRKIYTITINLCIRVNELIIHISVFFFQNMYDIAHIIIKYFFCSITLSFHEFWGDVFWLGLPSSINNI